MFQDACILVDPAYETFHPFMCTPFPETTRDPGEIRFNVAFKKARVILNFHISNFTFLCVLIIIFNENLGGNRAALWHAQE